MRKIALILLLLSGCVRGESKSLDEIFQIAKSNYSETSQAGLSETLTASLKSIEKNLTLISSSKELTNSIPLQEISDELSALLPSAGYTVRPALTELRNQYMELEESAKNGSSSTATLKLLATRTYSVLTEELHGQKFSIKS